MVKCRSIQLESMKKMIGLIESHMKTGKEHGMLLCKNGGKIIASNTCKGDKCAIDIEKLEKLSCPKGTREIGIYHTHPNLEYTLPSAEDIEVAITKNHKLICIGTGEKRPTGDIKIVHCYDIKNRKLKRLGKKYAKAANTEERDKIFRSIISTMSGRAVLHDVLEERCNIQKYEDDISGPSIALEEDGIVTEYKNGEIEEYETDQEEWM